MNWLKSYLRAKFPGGPSRRKSKSQADDGFTEPSSSANISSARSPSAGNYGDQRTVEVAESQNANTQTAGALVFETTNASATQRFGLQVVAEPGSGAAANVDIVFLHGLNGDPYTTWKAAGAEAPWPQLLLPAEIPRGRIMTYGADFSYAHWLKQAGQNTVREHATNLVTDLALKRYQTGTLDRPIIFVAYSLGGLVCECAIVLSNNSPEKDHRRVAEHTHGIVFLGTPHAGSDFTRFAKAVTNILRCTIVKKPNRAILDILSRQSEVLASIQKDFQNLLELRQQNHKPPIGIHCCQEELAVAATGHRVVTPDSAAFPGYHTSSTIPANHMDLPKFRNSSDIGFKRVSGRLRQWTDALSIHIDLDGLRDLANDVAELEARVHDKWRHLQMQPYRGSAINWEWFYDSYEYRTWSCNTNHGSGNVLWLSDPDPDYVCMSLYLSNLASTHLERCLPASSNDIVYFYFRGPPPGLGVSSAPDPLRPLDAGFFPPLAAVLCVFMAQVFTPRGDYFGRLNPKDHAALELAFQATKQILISQHDMHNRCSPEDLTQALAVLDKSEDLLWTIFGGSASAKRWRSLVVVLDGLDCPPPDEGHRFLEKLSKLQDDVSQAECSLRLVISSRYSFELDKVLGKNFLPRLLNLDRTQELNGFLELFRDQASNKRRHDIDTAKTNTGTWLFNSELYQKWEGSQRSCMLSLEGKAGSGKSTLMKHIFDSLVQEYQMWGGDKLFVTTGNKPKARFLVVPAAGRCYSWSGKQSQGDARSDEETQKEELGEADMEHPDIVIVASYFFHARGGETSHCDMLHSLIYQIVSQDDRLFSACETRYRRLRKRNHDRSSVVVWEFEELKQAFQEIVRYQIRSEPHPLSIRYYFLIDALDESDDNKVEQIVSLFRHDLDASPHSIKTVLASRPIRNFASSQSAPSSLYTILEGENGGDIELYTDSEMDFLLHDTDNPDQASRTSLFLSITGYIKENARGVFLWVVLICRALKNYARNGYSAAGLNQELESLPKDLEGFYQMMTQSLASNLEPRALEEARKILNWTIFARRPLTIAEMRDIIAIPFGDGIQFSPSPSFLENHRVVGWQGVKQKMRHTCGDLVEIIHHNRGSSRIDENDSVQLIHQTVQEFLLQDNGVAKPLATNHSLGTEIILGVCARYLEVCFLNEVWSPSRTPRLWKSSRFGAGDYQQFTKALASLPLLWYILRHLFTHMQVGPLITLRNSHSEAIQAILKCFRDWNNSNQRHILFLLEKWIKERQEAVRDFDLSFLESVKPGVAAEFRSGCLLAAVQQNNKTIIVDMGELLGAGFQGKDLATANELLFAAAASGDDALMTGLLVAGAQEICHDDAGLTPLHHAAANGHAVVINRFSHGHNPLDRNGQTPLHFAASKGHVDALTALVRGGATITAKDNFGRTPLHLAVGAGHEAVIWQLVWHLIPGSVLRNAQDKDGETSLHYAARLGNAAIVIRLLSFRVDYELKNVHGQTAQDIAVQNGHHTVVDALQAWKDHEKVPAPSED